MCFVVKRDAGRQRPLRCSGTRQPASREVAQHTDRRKQHTPDRQKRSEPNGSHDNESTQITTLLSLSILLLCLPWATQHPRILLVPPALALTPGVGEALRPVLREAAAFLLGGARLLFQLFRERWSRRREEAAAAAAAIADEQHQALHAQHAHGHGHDAGQLPQRGEWRPHAADYAQQQRQQQQQQHPQQQHPRPLHNAPPEHAHHQPTHPLPHAQPYAAGPPAHHAPSQQHLQQHTTQHHPPQEWDSPSMDWDGSGARSTYDSVGGAGGPTAAGPSSHHHPAPQGPYSAWPAREPHSAPGAARHHPQPYPQQQRTQHEQHAQQGGHPQQQQDQQHHGLSHSAASNHLQDHLQRSVSQQHAGSSVPGPPGSRADVMHDEGPASPSCEYNESTGGTAEKGWSRRSYDELEAQQQHMPPPGRAAGALASHDGTLHTPHDGAFHTTPGGWARRSIDEEWQAATWREEERFRRMHGDLAAGTRPRDGGHDDDVAGGAPRPQHRDGGGLSPRGSYDNMTGDAGVRDGDRGTGTGGGASMVTATHADTPGFVRRSYDEESGVLQPAGDVRRLRQHWEHGA